MRNFNCVPKEHFGLFLKECEGHFDTPDPKRQLMNLGQWFRKIWANYLGQPLSNWLHTLHTISAEPTAWDLRIQTGNRLWQAASRRSAGLLFRPLPDTLAADRTASIVSLDLRVRLLALLRPFLIAGDIAYRGIGHNLVLNEPEKLGDILLTFLEDQADHPFRLSHS